MCGREDGQSAPFTGTEGRPAIGREMISQEACFVNKSKKSGLGATQLTQTEKTA